MSFLAHKQMKTNFARETAQQVEILATKPNGLSSIPGLHMVEGENLYTHKLSSGPPQAHTHTHTKGINVKKKCCFKLY